MGAYGCIGLCSVIQGLHGVLASHPALTPWFQVPSTSFCHDVGEANVDP